jgi:peptidoglycan/LPS O-acetylase OafA/YrhL
MTLLVAAVVVPEEHTGARLLRHPLVAHVGVVSYGMYLLHQLCFLAVGRVLGRAPDVLAFFLAGTALTLALATVSYRWFEAPFLRAKARHAGAR